MISTAPLGAGAADQEPFSSPPGPVKVTASVASGAGPTGAADPPAAVVVEDGPVLDDDAPLPDFDESSPQPASRVVAAAAPTPSSISRRSASRRVRYPSAQSATISLWTYSSNAIAPDAIAGPQTRLTASDGPVLGPLGWAGTELVQAG